MSMDPQQPYQPYPQQQFAPPPQGRWGTSTLGNLGAEVMAGLAYLIAIVPFVGFIGQIILFAIEKNRFAKFHAAQAMLLGVLGVVLAILDWIITGAASFGINSSNGVASASGLGLAAVFGCVFFIVALVIFAFWIWGMVSAFTGKPTKLPIIGSIAEGLAGGPVSAI